jgi:FAD/FMN-containing dehydrogenase
VLERGASDRGASQRGRQVRCDRENEPDLFWALRSGGGSFGVVTAIELEL